MKCKVVSCLSLLVALSLICGCKKESSTKDPYSGYYTFNISSTAYPDSVIRYEGSVQYDKTSRVLTVNYMEEIYNPSFPYTIYPVVYGNGILSYPDWTQPPTGLFFNGTIDDNGSITFKIGVRIIHQGQTIESSRTVTGMRVLQ
ncbi:MAG: hypothetical protein ACOYNC_07255 [Bacteroidales bacterium]